MADPYLDTYQQQYEYDQQGYYDETGQWHYYEGNAYDPSYQPGYADANYSANQHEEASQHQYPQYGAAASGGYIGQAVNDWNQPNTQTTQSSNQESKKKSSINPRQIPRHVRRAANDISTDNRNMPIHYSSSDAHPPSPLDDCRILDDGITKQFQLSKALSNGQIRKCIKQIY